MSGKRKRLYYKLTPVFEPEPGHAQIANAAVVTCIATGRVLAGYGGGSDALAPEIVDQIDMRKTGGKSRIVCDADIFDSMLETLREADRQIEYLHGKFKPTGTGETVLARIRSVVAHADWKRSDTDYQPR